MTCSQDMHLLLFDMQPRSGESPTRFDSEYLPSSCEKMTPLCSDPGKAEKSSNYPHSAVISPAAEELSMQRNVLHFR